MKKRRRIKNGVYFSKSKNRTFAPEFWLTESGFMSFPLKIVKISQISRYLSFLINSNKDTIKKRILLFNKILIFKSNFGVYAHTPKKLRKI